MKKLLWLFLLLPILTTAQDSIRVDMSTPHATVYTHLYFLQSDSYEPKKAAKTILGLSEEKAIEKAIKIKQVLDGKGLYVDMNRVPTNANYKDTIGYSSYYRYVLFPERMPQIYVEKIGDNWYYSTETINKIESLYKSVYPWYIQKLQNIIPLSGHKKIMNIELWKIIGLLILFVLAYIIFLIVKRIAFFILLKLQQQITKNTNLEVNKVIKKLAHPISLLVALSFIDKAFPSLQFGLTTNTWVFLALNIAETVFWIYVFLKLVKVVMRIYGEFTERTHGRLDDQLVPILHSFLTGVVIVVGILRLLVLFGVDTTTMIAGATIGGLAFALASQDTVKNLIGTIMIFLDKPFHIDDWIEAGEVVGTVERVGFRSTQVRAADTSIYQIPNSRLSELVINNKGLRLFRRYNTNLGLRYDTPPELIEAFVKGVREIIIAHPETRSDSYNVEFTGFGDSALLVMVNVYFKSLAWGVEQSSKHRLHIAIVKLAKELGVDFAFPSTTVTIENFPEKKGLNPKYDINQERIDTVIATVVSDFNKENPNETVS
ncbi:MULTISPECIES: mechanosensitive ion channel family protein [Polaribacter]|uniref:Mechanosensitive ion channel family protein n=1 Tax=Polaribacter sejongensis TaxID=985043 RepID=A0AAJ1VGV3_9FLAO|nr:MULTISPECIES: mechanosensitive ion channel family protein [Polaribacter]AUC20957.1 mechanosensitive ion channel protein MscS [Polaribacter sejongensis]MDN3619704.1 mechanosensitive ion channel family protein [Polaribacter undariae]UWD31471.1 mechanosensitive ion channel family protein [Polaribacter undariae]